MRFTSTFDFKDVLIKPKTSTLTSRSEIDLIVSYKCKHSGQHITGFPLIVSNMSCVGTIKMAKALHGWQCFVALQKFINTEDLIKFFQEKESEFSFYSLGMAENEFDKLKYISQHCNISKIRLDAANGHMLKFCDEIKRLRDYFPKAIIMAGNVATPEGVHNIINSGADIVCAGIGNGNFCETRNKAGVGCKQFTVAEKCGEAARELGALCCSDGGCSSPADISKALAAGSHFVMVGSMFAGCEECESKWVDHSGKLIVDNKGVKAKMFMYGMSSKFANDKFCGGLKEYRASEGREGWVDYKGNASDVVIDIKGSVASCCTYTNTSKLQNLYENCEFFI
jgi:GMP reductase